MTDIAGSGVCDFDWDVAGSSRSGGSGGIGNVFIRRECQAYHASYMGMYGPWLVRVCWLLVYKYPSTVCLGLPPGNQLLCGSPNSLLKPVNDW